MKFTNIKPPSQAKKNISSQNKYVFCDNNINSVINTGNPFPGLGYKFYRDSGLSRPAALTFMELVSYILLMMAGNRLPAIGYNYLKKKRGLEKDAIGDHLKEARNHPIIGKFITVKKAKDFGADRLILEDGTSIPDNTNVYMLNVENIKQALLISKYKKRENTENVLDVTFQDSSTLQPKISTILTILKNDSPKKRRGGVFKLNNKSKVKKLTLSTKISTFYGLNFPITDRLIAWKKKKEEAVRKDVLKAVNDNKTVDDPPDKAIASMKHGCKQFEIMLRMLK